MKTFILSILFFTTGYISFGQTLNNLEFGTDETFDLVTWNLKYFPTNGQTTANYVKEIIENIDVDLLAIQEVYDTDAFQTMVDDIVGYDVYYAPNYLALAYIYKTGTVTVNDTYEIYSSFTNQFPRSPYVINLTFSGEDFIVINNHFKCCGDGYLDMYNNDDEEFRRYEASRLLKDYIDNNLANDRVIVVGDLNDVLTDNSSNNVFQMLIDDYDNFEFADMDIAQGSSSNWSYPSWPSHIDHILITDEIFVEMDNIGSTCETIKVDDYMNSYDYYVSDHLPVGLKVNLDIGTSINVYEPTEINLYCSPNPFSGETSIYFNSVDDQTEVEIYTISGQKVYSVQVSKGQKHILWNAERFSSGIYFTKLISGKSVIAISKMVLVN